MFGNFMQSLFKKNQAPEWFCRDVKNKVSEAEIKEKIKLELHNIVEVNSYNKQLWNEDFIGKMAALYYKFFDQLYMQSA